MRVNSAQGRTTITTAMHLRTFTFTHSPILCFSPFSSLHTYTMSPNLITIPLSVLTHPQTPSIPSICAAAAEHGGIPVPVPPPLFADCCKLAGLLGLEFDMAAASTASTDTYAFFRQVHAAVTREVPSLNSLTSQNDLTVRPTSRRATCPRTSMTPWT